mmetsp:Transcript_29998/g.64676  ORF Transcript_29998/g.64676 Transcript_29998/m.64676 type:complete len:438 (-) Transcript_29998:73-1386(-)
MEQLVVGALLVHGSGHLGHVEAVLLHPSVIHELAHVISGGIGQQDGTSLALRNFVLLDESVSTSHCGATAATDQQALMTNQGSAHRKCFIIIGLHPVVDDLTIKHGWDEIVTNALHLVGSQLLLSSAVGFLVHLLRLRQNAAIGINSHDFHARDQFLELLGNSGHSATCSGGHDHVVQLAFALLGDLLGSAIVVSQGVARVLVLIQDVTTEVFRQAGRQEDVAVFGVPGGLGGGSEDLSTKALHGVHLLTGHLLWQADDLLVAFDGRDHAQADASVAAGGLNEDVTRLNSATLLSLLNHSLGNTVLHRASGVEKLHLRDHFAINIEEVCQARHAHHRGEANQVKGGVANLLVRPATLDGANSELLEVGVNLLIPADVVRSPDDSLLGLIVWQLLHLARASNHWIHRCNEAALRQLKPGSCHLPECNSTEAGHDCWHG